MFRKETVLTGVTGVRGRVALFPAAQELGRAKGDVSLEIRKRVAVLGIPPGPKYATKMIAKVGSHDENSKSHRKIDLENILDPTKTRVIQKLIPYFSFQ